MTAPAVSRLLLPNVSPDAAAKVLLGEHPQGQHSPHSSHPCSSPIAFQGSY